MARVNYGKFTVLNPTPFKVVAGFDRLSKNGAEYVFAPFEEKEVYVKDHAEHICRSKQADGLVLLDYNEEAKKTFATYEDYRRARAIEGITQARNKYGEGLTYEQAAEAEAIKTNKVVELRSINTAGFEDKIDDLDNLAASLKAPVKKTAPIVKPTAPEWMTGKGESKTEDEKKEEPEILKTESGVEYKFTKNKKLLIKVDGKFKMASNQEKKELGIDISTDANKS